MSWTLCTSGSAIVKAGANANSTIVASGSALAEFSDEVEGTICAKTRYNWVSGYGSVTAQYKPILANIASDLIAMKIIGYDMSGYTSRYEALTMLNILKDNSDKIYESLERDEIKKKIGVSS